MALPLGIQWKSRRTLSISIGAYKGKMKIGSQPSKETANYRLTEEKECFNTIARGGNGKHYKELQK